VRIQTITLSTNSDPSIFALLNAFDASTQINAERRL
jgi:hypothetical protein